MKTADCGHDFKIELTYKEAEKLWLALYFGDEKYKSEETEALVEALDEYVNS